MTALVTLGYLVTLIGNVWLLVAAFRTSALWGVLCLCVPFASLVFIIKYWDRAARPFFVTLGGAAVIVVAVLIGSRMLMNELEAPAEIVTETAE
ncbi:MAG: hypothetical protein WBV82_06125 [Myxococcaceae bacterium]